MHPSALRAGKNGAVPPTAQGADGTGLVGVSDGMGHGDERAHAAAHGFGAQVNLAGKGEGTASWAAFAAMNERR